MCGVNGEKNDANDLAGCIPMQITTQNVGMSNEISFYSRNTLNKLINRHELFEIPSNYKLNQIPCKVSLQNLFNRLVLGW